jgi:hypothetical protein
MLPGDGYLRGLETELVRQVKDLYVEGESIDVSTSEDLASLTSAQQFEAALRIVEVRQTKRANDEVEHLPHPISIEGLANANVRLGKRTRAAHDSVAVSCKGLQPFQVFDGGRKIGIRDQDELSPAFLDAAAHGRPLSLIGRQDAHSNFRVSASRDSLRGSVLATVIDDQDLEWLASRPHVCEHAVQRRSDPRCFVVGGYDDR